MNKGYEEYERKWRAEALRGIEELVEEYKPRVEAIFGLQIGDVKVRENSASQRFNDYVQHCEQAGQPPSWLEKLKRKRWYKRRLAEERGSVAMCVVTGSNTIYVNPHWLQIRGSPDRKKKTTLHELVHVLVNHNDLIPPTSIYNLQVSKIKQFLDEGFAEYVAWDFPEIYQDEELKKLIAMTSEAWRGKADYNEWREDPHVTGHEFFRRVGEQIGRENILQVFKNLPVCMEEILEPGRYLSRAFNL